MRPRVVLLACVAAIGIGLLGSGVLAALPPSRSGFAAWVNPSPTDPEPKETEEPVPTAQTPPPPPPRLPTLASPRDPASIKVSGARLFGWALLDRRTGKITGSANSATVTNTVESMIKAWIASDYLRRLAEAHKQPTPQALKELTLMIVDSNDPMAEKYFQIGGSDAVVKRLISRCGLTRVTIKPTLWSWTLMTPQDAVKYGLCVGDGRAAGPQWTTWILNTMKKVRGGVADQKSGTVQGGRWGIIDGLPPELAKDTSIKNGWTLYRDGWHVNCLAVHPDWTLSVMIRTTKGLKAAADNCKSVAEHLVVNP